MIPRDPISSLLPGSSPNKRDERLHRPHPPKLHYTHRQRSQPRLIAVPQYDAQAAAHPCEAQHTRLPLRQGQLPLHNAGQQQRTVGRLGGTGRPVRAERRQRVADHQQLAVKVDRAGAGRLVDRLHERPLRFLDEFAEGAGEDARGERELLGPHRGVQLADGDGAAVLVSGAVGHDAREGGGVGGVVGVPGVVVGAVAGG